MTYTDQQLLEIQERAHGMHQTAMALFWKQRRKSDDADAWLLRHQFEIIAALVGFDLVERAPAKKSEAA